MKSTRIDSGWQPLEGEVFYRHLCIEPSSGRLCQVASRRLAVRSKKGLLVALGLHEAVPPDVQTAALTALLSQSSHPQRGQALMRLVEAEVWRLHQTGGFYRDVPDVLATCVDGGEPIVVWRAGANGVAVVNEAGLSLASEDLRYGALRRLGVDIDVLRPSGLGVDPLADEVVALSQIEPDEAAQQEILVARGAVAILMSRGAFPFAPPAGVVSSKHWWGLDGGWRHGMAAELVVIAGEDEMLLAEEAVQDFGRHSK